jgi:hypothetical protein
MQTPCCTGLPNIGYDSTDTHWQLILYRLYSTSLVFMTRFALFVPTVSACRQYGIPVVSCFPFIMRYALHMFAMPHLCSYSTFVYMRTQCFKWASGCK